MFNVERVSSEIVRPLRHRVLRPNLPLEDSILSADDLFDSAHFTVKKDNIILSVASVFKELFEAMPTQKSYRLRGMATEPSEQRKGFGTMILHGAMDHLKKETDVGILWCNARVTAFGFYEKTGFTIVGEIFDIPNLGPHKTGFIEL